MLAEQMNNRLQWIVLLMIGLLWGSQLLALDVGENAPDLEGTLYQDGKKTSISALLKKGPMVLAFFSVTCYPCRLEAPLLSRLEQEYTKKGVTFLYVNVDDDSLRLKISAYLKITKSTLRVFLPNAEEAKASYQAYGLPKLLLLNQGGQVIASHEGFDRSLGESLERELSELLAIARTKG